MGRCLTATPTPSSPTSIRPSARRSGSRPARCASSPARGAARPGSSRDGSPTRSRPTSSGHATCWSSRSPTRPPARCVRRLAALGHPGVAASTFHAAALRQLRHFWPRVHGSDPPSILDSKVPILAPLAAGLPGGYRFLAVRDLAGEIEWAKARRIRPNEYEMRAIADDRDASLPPDLMAGLYRRYETAKARAGRIDFEDMLELTIGLIEADATIAAEVRDRYRWFSVDEYQDTNPLQAALLDAWLGGREDLAVVGDEDQTIYTFTGATSDYLIGFAERYPSARVVAARDQLPLDARGPRAGQPGPRRRPGRRRRTTSRSRAAAAEAPGREPRARAGARDRRLRDRRGRAGRDDRGDPGARAGRDRTRRDRDPRANERPAPRDRGALGAAGIPFHVRGERFFARPEVRRAMRVAGALARVESEEPLVARLSAAFERELGVRRDTVPEGEAAANATARSSRSSSWPRTWPGRIRRRTWRRSSPRSSGGPRSRPAGGDRRRTPDLPPRQGPRVGRGLPARARGRHAADPPVDRARRAGRGATPALRRDHPGAALPVAVVGHDPDGGVGTRRPAQPLALPRRTRAAVGPPARGGRDAPDPGEARPRERRRSTRPTGRRCRTRSVPGARPVPAPTPSPRSSSSTTRPSRPSRPAARARSRSSAASRASAR